MELAHDSMIHIFPAMFDDDNNNLQARHIFGRVWKYQPWITIYVIYVSDVFEELYIFRIILFCYWPKNSRVKTNHIFCLFCHTLSFQDIDWKVLSFVVNSEHVMRVNCNKLLPYNHPRATWSWSKGNCWPSIRSTQLIIEHGVRSKRRVSGPGLSHQLMNNYDCYLIIQNMFSSTPV